MTIIKTIAPLRPRIALSGFGNPLSNSNWSEFVDKYKKSGGQIGLVIHATHLTGPQRDRLLDVQPSFCEISFPSADESYFRQLCPHSDYHMAKESLVSLASNPQRRFPIVVVALATHINPDEESLATAQWRQYGLSVRVLPCHSRAGALKNSRLLSSPIQKPVDLPCGLVSIHAFVTWQGKLLSCCHDMTGESELGDLCSDSLDELMQRKMASISVANPFSFCHRCDDPYRLVRQPLGPFPTSRRQRRQAMRKLVAQTMKNPTAAERTLQTHISRCDTICHKR